MLIWRNLDPPSMGRLLVAASRRYKTRPNRPERLPDMDRPLPDGSGGGSLRPPDATQEVPMPPDSHGLMREIYPGWLRMVVTRKG